MVLIYYFLIYRCMKYIKSKKIFESSEVVDTVKDICLELEDDGLNVEHFTESSLIKGSNLLLNYNVIYISSTNWVKGKETFKYSVVEEVIERLKEYLGDRIHSMKARRGLANNPMVDIGRLTNRDNIFCIVINYEP